MSRQKQAAGKLGLTHRNGMSAGFVLHALLVCQFFDLGIAGGQNIIADRRIFRSGTADIEFGHVFSPALRRRSINGSNWEQPPIRQASISIFSNFTLDNF